MFVFFLLLTNEPKTISLSFVAEMATTAASGADPSKELVAITPNSESRISALI